MRGVEYKPGSTGWMRFNRGPRQFTVRYAFDSGTLDVWHGYCFLKLWHYTRNDDLDDVCGTANWLASWSKEETTSLRGPGS